MFEPKKATLPLASEAPGAVTVSVYDPAMCCTSGVCGPVVDPELQRISQDLRWVELRGAREWSALTWPRSLMPLFRIRG